MSKFTAFHWPDHTIGKGESRAIREAHNALYNSHAELLDALQYARRFVKDCDTAFIDAAIQKATA